MVRSEVLMIFMAHNSAGTAEHSLRFGTGNREEIKTAKVFKIA